MTAVRVLGIGLEISPECPVCDLLAAAKDFAHLIESALFVQRAGECRMYSARELSALSLAADSVLSLIEAAEVVREARR